MGIVGDHEQPVPSSGDSAIDSAGGVAGQVGSPSTLVMPDRTSVACVKRPAFVGTGDVHDAFDDHGRHLQVAAVWHGEDPARRNAGDVRGVDLREFAETAPPGLTVITGPGRLRSYLAIAVSGFAKQM